MKTLITLLFLISAQSLFADKVVWRTYTGWDHGYSITIDSSIGKITMIKYKGRGIIESNISKDFEQSKGMVVYVNHLLASVKGGGVGEDTDDGRIIEVSVEHNGKMVKKTINYIDAYPFIDKNHERTKKVADHIVKELKELAEPYLVQLLMFQLKEQYFSEHVLKDKGKGS